MCIYTEVYPHFSFVFYYVHGFAQTDILVLNGRKGIFDSIHEIQLTALEVTVYLWVLKRK